MKNLLFSFALIAIISCSSTKKNIVSITKYEIIKIDSTKDYFVFKVKKSKNRKIIVIAEKDKFDKCIPFKRFIVSDSIHEISKIKSGNRYDFVGYNLSYIGNIKIKDKGSLIKTVNNCASFSN